MCKYLEFINFVEKNNNKMLYYLENLNKSYLEIINLQIDYKEIKLGGKKSARAIISKKDYNILSKYKWHLKDGYAVGWVDYKKVKMHRFIVGASDEKVVDHINGNRLDNRRENLRVTTKEKNAENRRKISGQSTSKYFGVYYNSKRNKYCSRIRYECKIHFLGNFNTEREAAERRDHYIIKHQLNHIQLNFPEKKEYYEEKEYCEKNKDKKVKYIGVHYDKNKNIYTTQLRYNSKILMLHRFDNPLQCAKEYDKCIVLNNIPNKTLNFPSEYPDYNPKNILVKTNFIEISDKVIRLLLSSGENVIVDYDDYERIKYYNCFTDKINGYAKILVNNRNTYLHRYLLNVTDPNIFVDHIDGNKLNNTKENLRLSSPDQNSKNKKKINNATSKYIGVSRLKK